MIYTVTFNPALDCVVRVSNVKHGIVNRCVQQDIYYGGKGVNVSVVLNNIGIPNKALGFAAGPTGQALLTGIESMGVDHDFVMLPEGQTRINVKMVEIADADDVYAAGEETAINASGPNIDAASLSALNETLEQTREGDIVVLSGAAHKSVPVDAYASIVAAQAAKGVRTVVDVTGPVLDCALSAGPFLVKPNDEEIAEILDVEDPTFDQIVEGARMLQEKGAVNVIVSLGSKGSVLLDEFGNLHQAPLIKGKLVNSVGAGDSMVAGFVGGYQQAVEAGLSGYERYEHAFKLAQACGSATAFSAGLAEKDLVDELLARL
ncbi:Tagatose-6-phosphate kinase [Slackia heliotrinireducens]|jgi:1-phosphofructokinase|uniref:1-phosphofructokinase n=1 Tax=Slackia heliotrinireducens (strain ATCC 29202 / DSM 20476 / NCTC 11029 / RHS 1) TaxID=471855 RepID=C7N618_SLAHD|nr:1-phosphofructokinase family hexose kinase [Slackia heliotrinireducens]ACV22353.1 1-phosphofructokinase [Slackia heliotrinireducens DSM 20476]VEH00610.1 Tagatose-6-phosphate kinase [Slackia heliotrinireducens]